MCLQRGQALNVRSSSANLKDLTPLAQQISIKTETPSPFIKTELGSSLSRIIVPHGSNGSRSTNMREDGWLIGSLADKRHLQEN